MLIKGLGRVEGTVEDLQPVTLKQLIPIELLNSFIGIYWHVGKGKFIIYKAPLLDAKCIMHLWLKLWGRIMMSRAIQMIYR